MFLLGAGCEKAFLYMHRSDTKVKQISRLLHNLAELAVPVQNNLKIKIMGRLLIFCVTHIRSYCACSGSVKKYRSLLGLMLITAIWKKFQRCICQS